MNVVEIRIKNVLSESYFIFIHVKIFYIHLLADYVLASGIAMTKLSVNKDVHTMRGSRGGGGGGGPPPEFGKV